MKKDILRENLVQIKDNSHGFNKQFVEDQIYKHIVPILGSPRDDSEDISEYFY